MKNFGNILLLLSLTVSLNFGLLAKDEAKTKKASKKTESVKAAPNKKVDKKNKKKNKSEEVVGTELEVRKQWYSRADEYEQKIIKALDEIDVAMSSIHETYDKLDPEVAIFRDKLSDSLGALQGIVERLQSYLDQKLGVLSVKDVYFGDGEGGGTIGKTISGDIEDLKVSVELYRNQVEDIRRKMGKVASKATSLIDVLQKASRKRSDANIASIEAGKKKLAITTASADDAKKFFNAIVGIEGQVAQLKEELKGEISKSISSMADSIRKKIKKITNDESSLRSKAKELEQKVEDLGKKEAQLASADEKEVANGIKADLAEPMESKEKIEKEEKKVKIVKRTIGLSDVIVAYTKELGHKIYSILNHIWTRLYTFFSRETTDIESSLDKKLDKKVVKVVSQKAEKPEAKPAEKIVEKKEEKPIAKKVVTPKADHAKKETAKPKVEKEKAEAKPKAKKDEKKKQYTKSKENKKEDSGGDDL